MSKSLFITGTGTDVGKTYVTALIVKRLNELENKVAYFKPVMSGNVRDENGVVVPGDGVVVKNISLITQEVNTMCPYVYEIPVSPHLAGKMENNPAKLENIKKSYKDLEDSYEYITVEGAGGICCPFSFGVEKLMQEDLIKEFDWPCLIVADTALGTINKVVLTVSYMRSKGIKVLGIVFNNFTADNFMEIDNIAMCEELTGVKVIACVQKGDDNIHINMETLKSFYS